MVRVEDDRKCLYLMQDTATTLVYVYIFSPYDTHFTCPPICILHPLIHMIDDPGNISRTFQEGLRI